MSGYTDTPRRTAPSVTGLPKNLSSGVFAASEAIDTLLNEDENLSALSHDQLVSFCRDLKQEIEWQEQREQRNLNAQKIDHAETLRKTEESAAAEIEAQTAKIQELQSKNRILSDENIDLNKIKKEFEENWATNEDDARAATIERDRVLKQLNDLKGKLASEKEDCAGWKSELDQQAALTQKANETIRRMDRAAQNEAEKYRQQEVEFMSLKKEVKNHQKMTSELQKRMGLQTGSPNSKSPIAEPSFAALLQSEKGQGHTEEHKISLSSELPSSTAATPDAQLGDGADHEDSGFWDDSSDHVSTSEALPNDAVQDLGTFMDFGGSRRFSLNSSIGSPALRPNDLDSIDIARSVPETKSYHSAQGQHGIPVAEGTLPVVPSCTKNPGISSIVQRILAIFASVLKFSGAYVWTMHVVVFAAMIIAIIAETYQYQQWTNANGLSRAMFMAAEDKPWCVRMPRADYALSLITPSGLPRLEFR